MDCYANQRRMDCNQSPMMPPPPCNSVPNQMISPSMSLPPVSFPMPPSRPDSCFERDYPAGMAYVPWQQWGQTYNLAQGLQRGTIFPELDYPFVMGRCR